MSARKKIGLIAGGGALPHEVISGAEALEYDVFVGALLGFSRPEDFSVQAKAFGFGEIGGLIKAFKGENCTHVSFAGTVSRPDFKKIKPDFKGIRLLPKVIAAAKAGDDALLKFIVSIFEKEGFEIIAPQDLCSSTLVELGALGAVTPNKVQMNDIEKAMKIASVIGQHDIGQGAVVCDGLVLAVEAQEGTDQMLSRVAALAANVRGTEAQRAGVLAKRLKPGQEERIDLPTIGVDTVKGAARAGLAGIAVEAGKAFIMDKNSVRKLADECGLFIYAIKPSRG